MMSKVAVVFWSGTGNTEAMANQVVEGAKGNGAEVDWFTAAEFEESLVPIYDAIAFGCPSMGNEVLEESEFEPYFSSIESELQEKKVALFGSYGWGDGQWMRDWVQRTQDANANLYQEQGLMINETPDEDGLEQCREFGRGFAKY